MNSGIVVPANLYPGTIKHGPAGVAIPGQGSSHLCVSIVCAVLSRGGKRATCILHYQNFHATTVNAYSGYLFTAS